MIADVAIAPRRATRLIPFVLWPPPIMVLLGDSAEVVVEDMMRLIRWYSNGVLIET